MHPRTRLGRTASVVAAALAVALVSAGCTTDAGPGIRPSASHSAPVRASTPAPSGTPAGMSCPVTAATTDGVPKPIRAQKPGAVVGHGDLWVRAWWLDPAALAQVRSGSLGAARYPYQEKYPTWTLLDGRISDARGAPSIRVTRLDGPGRGAGSAAGWATDSRADGEVWHWWPTGVEFSRHGCWRVSEFVGSDSLSYTVEI